MSLGESLDNGSLPSQRIASTCIADYRTDGTDADPMRRLQPMAGLDGVSTTFPGTPPAIFSAQRRGPSGSVPTFPTTARKCSMAVRRANSESCSRFGLTTKNELFTSAPSALGGSTTETIEPPGRSIVQER